MAKQSSVPAAAALADAVHPREVRALIVAGAVGGALAMGIALLLSPVLSPQMPLMMRVADVARFSAFLGAAIGLAVGAAEGLARRNVPRALPGAFIGLFFGALGNAVAGGLMMYLQGNNAGAPLFAAVLQVVHYALLGVALGFGWAMPSVAERKMEIGVLGGALGGALAGVIFAIFPSLGPAMLLIAGIGIGAGIGVTEELARKAWLEVTAGPLRGSRFILYPIQVHLGRHPRSAIAIADPGITPLHATISPDATDYVLTTPDPDAVTRVNGRRINKHFLQDGDEISVGETLLTYHRRGQEE